MQRTATVLVALIVTFSGAALAQAPEGDVMIVVENADGVDGETRATVVPIEGSESLAAPRPEDAPVVLIFPPGSQVRVRPQTPDAAVPPTVPTPPVLVPPAPRPPMYAPPAFHNQPHPLQLRIDALLDQRPSLAPRIVMMSLGGVGTYIFGMMSSLRGSWTAEPSPALNALTVLSASAVVVGTVLLIRALKVRRRINREIRTLRDQLAIAF